MNLNKDIIIHALHILESNNLIRLNKDLGNWYSCYCPYHNDGKERKASSGVSLISEYRNGRKLESGTFNCFTCHTVRSLPELISDLLKVHKVDLDSISWIAENIPELSEYMIDSSDFESLLPKTLVDQLNNTFALKYIHGKLNVDADSKILEDELSKYRFTTDYMYKRGLTDAIIAKYDVGVDLDFIPPTRKRKVPCITFPVKDSKGVVRYICRRSISGKSFYLPENIDKQIYGLYELPKYTNIVTITESCFNCLTAVRYGYPAIALLGTGSWDQIRLLKQLGVKEFILCFDGDDAGHRATKRLKKALKSVAIVRSIAMPDGKDLNDLWEDSNQIHTLFNQRI